MNRYESWLQVLKKEIANAGFFPFSRYMELVLLHPRYGYYSASPEVFGQDGDFVTAPELTPFFAYTMAKIFLPTLKESPAILELGPGSGQFASDCMAFLARQGIQGLTYFLYEKSPLLREKQQHLLAGAPFAIQWLDELPEAFNGVIFANEFFDSLPVEIVRWDESGAIYERGVGIGDQGLHWVERIIEEGPLYEAAEALPVLPPYYSEIHLVAQKVMAKLASALKKGAMIIVDYGYEEQEYYGPMHDRGTLICHVRHRAYENPLRAPGASDLTSHVNFSALARIAVQIGLKVESFTTLAQFLLQNGFLEHLQGIEPTQLQKSKYLLDPRLMGERFKVLAMDAPLL
jgi:SAM-dependent MidA family methyltransferase